MKIRILELGSTFFQLHGFEVTVAGAVRHRWGIKRAVHLIDGLASDGTLSAEYAKAGADAIADLLLDSLDDHPLVCFATSAVREARNRYVLLDPLARRFGVVPRILSGEEEARLAYAGALTALDGPMHRVCVVDIGGGSTEVAVGDHRGVGFTHSARVGMLLGEASASAFDSLLAPVLRRVRVYEPNRLVFASGSARAIRTLLVAQGVIDRHAAVPTELLERLLPNLTHLCAPDFARFGVAGQEGSTLATGAQLILSVSRALGRSYFDVSEAGLREGAALREWNRRRLRPGGCVDPISDRPHVPYGAAAGGWLPSTPPLPRRLRAVAG